MRILIVEDDAGLSAVVRRGLEESGHIVDVECNGHAGQCTAAAGAYDALVLDVALPD